MSFARAKSWIPLFNGTDGSYNNAASLVQFRNVPIRKL